MDAPINIHAVVALLENTAAQHFETGQPLLLRRGQIGTVVMAYDGTAYEIEFSDPDGHAYAMLPVHADKLLVLYDSPQPTAA